MHPVENPDPFPDAKGKELLSYEDVAELLGVTKRTVQTYINNGWIRTITITGRTKRIRRSDLNRFLDLAAEGKLPPPHSRPVAQLAMPI